MRARRDAGHNVGGLPYEIFNFLGSSFTRQRGEIEADGKKCNLCKKCEFECRRHAIYIDKKCKIWTLYPNRCNLCLQCVRVCSANALKVV
ncbi:ATP-binding protein [Methanobrevibacter sp.]|uniref:ATP-binding protein n=1 Tax=Methanobrevibacter sp. TaxID=66852 RepID=UPI00388E0226